LLFEQFSTAAQATAAELGVGLLHRFLVKKEACQGEPRVIFVLPVPTKSGYYLLIPSENID
jgi:LysR family glycine cleavage system transcriptional activator|tara:strand:- start:393 stop:575 length:183 start_codon:yes stop_codon:yes gene_type:complete